MPRQTYTPVQIQHVYNRLSLPERWRLSPGTAKTISQTSEGLESLSALQRYFLANIPYENLDLHYSRTKTVDMHSEILFEKIVNRGMGRGGYCMENNALFSTLLRSLGFQIYVTSGRVSSTVAPAGGGMPGGATWFGFAHMITIVTIGGRRYMVDVGFGAGAATRPLELVDGAVVEDARPSQETVRLRYDVQPENESTCKLWIYERKYRPEDSEWHPCYCFPDNVEFLPADFVMMNHCTSTQRDVFFTYMILVVRFLLNEDGSQINGEVMLLGNKLSRRVNGVKEDLGQLHNEQDRIEALEKYFGIRLSELERTGIIGMPSMIAG